MVLKALTHAGIADKIKFSLLNFRSFTSDDSTISVDFHLQLFSHWLQLFPDSSTSDSVPFTFLKYLISTTFIFLSCFSVYTHDSKPEINISVIAFMKISICVVFGISFFPRKKFLMPLNNLPADYALSEFSFCENITSWYLNLNTYCHLHQLTLIYKYKATVS